jgi:apolipoprotein N-acyltransferase
MNRLKVFLNNNFIFILPIVSGVMLIFAYPPYNLEFLIWLALIPFLFFISLKQVSLKKSFIGGFVLGIVFLGKSLSWLLATYPFEWLGSTTIKKEYVLVLLIILYIIQTAFLGLFFAGLSLIVKKIIIRNKKSYFCYLIIIPCLWIVFEYLRAWGFGILYLGKETLFGPHWTFGNLAYSLHNNYTLIQLTDITGIYGISFLIVLINCLLFLFFQKIKNKSNNIKIPFLLIILSGIFLVWIGYGHYKLGLKTPGEQKNIAVIQTNFISEGGINAYTKEEIFKTLIDMLNSPENAVKNSDIVIEPEGFGIVSSVNNQDIAKYLLKNFWRPNQIFLENKKIIDEKNQIKSRLFYYNLENKNPVAFHDKMLLVPNGDFVPYLTKLFLKIYSFGAIPKQRFYEKGEINDSAQTPQGKIGGAICSSIVSPNLNREQTKKGAQFLVVVSSDAPFHGSKSLLGQNLAMSKIRAVENNRYFAQATNMGYSFLINPRGQVISMSEKFGNEILFSEIKLIDKKTIYTQFGDWIIVFAILVLIFAFLRIFKNYKISLDTKNNV